MCFVTKPSKPKISNSQLSSALAGRPKPSTFMFFATRYGSLSARDRSPEADDSSTHLATRPRHGDPQKNDSGIDGATRANTEPREAPCSPARVSYCDHSAENALNLSVSKRSLNPLADGSVSVTRCAIFALERARGVRHALSSGKGGKCESRCASKENSRTSRQKPGQGVGLQFGAQFSGVLTLVPILRSV